MRVEGAVGGGFGSERSGPKGEGENRRVMITLVGEGEGARAERESERCYWMWEERWVRGED